MSNKNNNTNIESFWEEPPKPPPSSLVMPILAVTLQQALTELQQNQQQQRQQRQQRERNEETPQEDPSPPQPTRDDEGNPSNDATSTNSNNSHDDSHDDNNDDANHAKQSTQEMVPLDASFVSHVTRALSQAVAAQKVPHAPAAVVHGRVESYNRHGAKWRIVLDQAKFRQRQDLPRHRRKYLLSQRQTLWYYADPSRPENQREGVPPEALEIACPRLEILAYNDAHDDQDHPRESSS